MHAAFRKATRNCLLRTYASATNSSGPVNPYTVGPFQVFDRKVKLIQKDRAALRDGGHKSRTVDYVRDEIADMMMERFLVSSVIVQMRVPPDC